jgi:DNA-binding MarR family transcriptional regulator
MQSKKVDVLRRTFLALDRAMGNHARTEAVCCGVTLSQCHTIIEIGLAGKVSVKDLSDTLGLDKSTMSRTIEGLVVAGLVDRAADKEDRRYVVLTLTAKGITTFEMINNIWHRFCGELLKNIPLKKHDMMIESMVLLLEALQKNDFGKNFVKSYCQQQEVNV